VRIQYRVKDRRSVINPSSKVISKKTAAKTCSAGTQFSAVLL